MLRQSVEVPRLSRGLMASRPALSVTEREVLKVLWDHGPSTVRKLNAVLKKQGR
jgi:hypothetical protein